MIKLTLNTKLIVAGFLLLYFIVAIQPWNLFFLNDDFVHIPLSTKSIWVHFQFFRPVPNLVSALEVKLFGTQAAAFHVTSILLHIIATYCVGILCQQLIELYGDREKYQHAGFIASCLFFIYPFHAEPVMWIIGRIGILATIFIVVSLIFFLKRFQRRYFYSFSLCSFIIALLTYETSWILPVLITVFTILDHWKNKRGIRKELFYLVPYWICFGAFLIVRSVALKQLVTEYEMSGRNLSPTSLVGKFASLLARTIVPPAESSAWFSVFFACVAIILLGFLFYLLKTRNLRRLHYMVIAFLLISYLPVISLGMDTHGSEGERYIYLPSVFWIILVTALLYELPLKTAGIVLGSLVLTYSVLLAVYGANYRHGSLVAREVLHSVRNIPVKGKVIALNIPSNYKGVLIFRSGFKEAVHWFYPALEADSIIVIPANRTFEKIHSIQAVTKNELNRIYAAFLVTNQDGYSLTWHEDTISYDTQRDLLIFFDDSRRGYVIYPTSSLK